MNKTAKYKLINKETWKDIPGYEGLYQVSDTGNIKSLDREITQTYCGKHYTRKMRGRFIKPGVQNSGYEMVWLSKGGDTKALTVHRLVMIAFSGPNEPLLDVNHIDGNKKNNRLENLEWCTRSENVKHSYNFTCRKQHGNSVKCIELGIVFVSSAAASRATGINAGGILHAVSGVARTAGGYTWERM